MDPLKDTNVRHAIGDELIALQTLTTKDHTEDIEKGKLYFCTGVYYCSSCGDQSVNVSNNPPVGTKFMCACCKHTIDAMDLRWVRSKHFAKKKDLLRAKEKAIEIQDYETAAILRDVLEPGWRP